MEYKQKSYTKLETVGEGSQGIVYKAIENETKRIVAVKKMIIGDNQSEGIPQYTLREISILKQLDHPNITRLLDVQIINQEELKISLVFDYYPCDLAKYLRELKKMDSKYNLQFYQNKFYQIISAVDFYHSKGILHRDLKPQNILVDENENMKISDFGLARAFFINTNKEKTQGIQTLWYRAPEILLGSNQYETEIDIWSLGCILAEIVTKKPIMIGDGTQIGQIFNIFSYTGTPTIEEWPQIQNMTDFKFSFPKFKRNPEIINSTEILNIIGQKGLDLIEKMLQINPQKRISAHQALNHQFFQKQQE